MQEDHWLKFTNGSQVRIVKVSKHDMGINLQLQQDYGHFTVATVDVTEVPPDCNCINTARMWSVS